MKSTLSLNDKIHVKGHTTDFTQNVTSMQINHQQVNTVKKGQEIGIQVKGKVRHKDKVYKVG
jgi:translation initiation factor IF-2